MTDIIKGQSVEILGETFTTQLCAEFYLKDVNRSGGAALEEEYRDTFVEAFDEDADEIIEYLDVDPDYIYKPKKHTTEEIKAVLTVVYMWQKCGEHLKRVGFPVTQENLDKAFTRGEQYTVNEINELIDNINHLCSNRDAAYDEAMYFMSERYPSLEEDSIVECTDALFEFIEGHLDLDNEANEREEVRQSLGIFPGVKLN